MAPPRRYFECHDPFGDWISDLEREDGERRHAREFDEQFEDEQAREDEKDLAWWDYGFAK